MTQSDQSYLDSDRQKEARLGPPSRLHDLEHQHVDAVEIDGDGGLRLFRRRGLFGIWRRQDIYHPADEWLSVTLEPNGDTQVRCCS